MGQVTLTFSRTTMALCLWEFGEDDLWEAALSLTDAQLRQVQAIALRYESPSVALPVVGQRISSGHCIALAAVTYFEGDLRPLARGRRRAKRDTPERLLVMDLDYGTGRGHLDGR